MCKVKMLAVVALAFGFVACKKKEPPLKAEEPESTAISGSAATGSGAAMGSGSAMAGSGVDAAAGLAGSPGSAAGSGDAGADSGDAGMVHHAGNCPSAVLGAVTTAEVKAKAVVITVSSKDKDAIAAIQKRADEMLKVRADGKLGEAHDRQGSHGGKSGMCPIVIPDGAKAAAKHDKAGVVATITPTDKVDELKAEVDRRIAKAAEWVKANIEAGDQGNTGGVGGGKGKDGSNHSGKGDGKGRDRKASAGSAGSAAKK